MEPSRLGGGHVLRSTDLYPLDHFFIVLVHRKALLFLKYSFLKEGFKNVALNSCNSYNLFMRVIGFNCLYIQLYKQSIKIDVKTEFSVNGK